MRRSFRKTHALAILIIAFVVSRTAYVLLGNRFEVALAWWQFLDPELLKSQLLLSLWYLHSQPPLLNLSLGVALKLFPQSYTLALNVAFAGLGLALALVLFSLMTDMGVPVWLALATTLPFEVGPGTLMFENCFYDTYPTAFCLCLAAFSLNRFLMSGDRIYGTVFVWSAALPFFFNSAFQIIWLIGIGALLFVALRGETRSLLRPALAVLAAALIWSAKNFILFGTITTSSWLGMNLSTMSTYQLPASQRLRLVAEGKLSWAALIGVFPRIVSKPSPPMGALTVIYPLLPLQEFALAHQIQQSESVSSAYRMDPSGLSVTVERSGVAALDADVKTTRDFLGNKATNYNNLAYVALSKLCLRDAFWVVVNRPSIYLRAVAVTAEIYLQPAQAVQSPDSDVSSFPAFRAQMNMRRWIELYEFLLLPARTNLGNEQILGPGASCPACAGFMVSITLLIAIPALTLYALVNVAQNWKASASADNATLLFIFASISFVMATGILFNAQENSRFRFTTDPLYLVLIALFFSRASATARSWYEKSRQNSGVVHDKKNS